jgi:hypothetical protein
LLGGAGKAYVLISGRSYLWQNPTAESFSGGFCRASPAGEPINKQRLSGIPRLKVAADEQIHLQAKIL